jgi:hypothetical protein
MGGGGKGESGALSRFHFKASPSTTRRKTGLFARMRCVTMQRHAGENRLSDLD